MEEKQVSDNIEYAGFWRRGAALAIDLIIYAIPSIIINIIAFKGVSFFAEAGSDWTLQSYFYAQVPYWVVILVSLASQLCWAAIVAWFLAVFRWQATPGKRLMKAYVVNKDASSLSYNRAFVRTFLPIIFVILLNLTNLAVINKSIEFKRKAYEQAMIEFFPGFYKEMEGLGMTHDEFMETEEGQEAYTDAVNSLSPEKEAQFAARVKELIASNQLYYSFTKAVPFIFLVFVFCWYVVAAFTKEKTATHDIIMGTRVVKGRV